MAAREMSWPVPTVARHVLAILGDLTLSLRAATVAGQPMKDDSTDQLPGHRRAHSDAAAIATNVVWVAMSALVFAYIWKYGRNFPYMEDWELVPTLSGATPFRLGWLVEQTGEHRYILAKAILYPLWQLTYDGRSSMLLSAALLSAITLALMITARRLRGHGSLADAFFPLALLHTGHAETLIFFIQLCFVLPVVLFTVALLLIVTGRWERQPAAAWTIAVCVVLLPLNGAIGLLLAPAFVAWMAWVVVTRRTPAVFGVAAFATTALAALYFVGYQRPSTFVPLERTVRGSLRTLVEVFSVGLGPGGAWLWPWSGIAIGGVFAIAAIGLTVVALRRPHERTRAIGLLACVAAIGLLVAGIAWGRTVIGPGAGIPARYALLVAPGLCAAFLASIVYVWSPTTSRLAQLVLAACAAGLLWSNVEVGREYGRPRAAAADVARERLAAGTPSPVVAARYAEGLYPNVGPLAAALEMLRAQRSGPFAGLADPFGDRPCRPAEVALTQSGVHDASIVGGRLECRGNDGFAVYALSAPADVCTVTVVYEFVSASAPEAAMQIYWSLDGANGFEEIRRNQSIRVDSSPGERAVRFDVYDRLDRLRLDPDRQPCVIRIVRIELTSRD